MAMRGSEPIEGSPLTAEDFRDAAFAARRGGARVPCDRPVSIRRCSPGDDRGFRPARLLNCSINGLGLFTDEALAPGEEFIVQIKLERVVLALYTVRYCRRLTDRYVVGAELSGFIRGQGDPDPATIMKMLTEG